MNKLRAELQRLFALPDEAIITAPGRGYCTRSSNDTGSVRVLRLRFAKARDWPAVETLLTALKNDFDLPLPTLSVDGGGYCLWFSLQAPVDRAQGELFLNTLRQHYLSELPEQRSEILSDSTLSLPPSPLAEDERWQAFIDPSMGSMFVDEPWLEFPPGEDRQAELLSAFQSIPLRDFQQAQALLQAAVGTREAPAAAIMAAPAASASPTLNAAAPFDTPQQFLMAVINDERSPLALRIEAAKALLPYMPTPDR